MAEALLLLLQDDSLRIRYKQAGYRRLEAFKTDRIVEKWMNVLKKL